MTERIIDGETEGEYTDSEIPGQRSPHEHPRMSEPAEYTDSEIPGEPRHHGAADRAEGDGSASDDVADEHGEYTDADIPGEGRRRLREGEGEYTDSEIPGETSRS